ncbi:glycosyltransferase family 2 protein [Lacticaseibacillus zhaodongensis]|uniref:glycosyltransferase family 2 protein n=1 Tax=Lacticaseibacillus zhaodongensis TaxID=2668065 RepID=UPI0018AF6DA4|nr:glycosyltransferase family 2 protein [Lacticaseibacillus zhaodongensis]
MSVIIPIYNQMEYLPRCLASVARQTYRNIEVIMVNDGSSDESQIAMDAFERIDRRFHAISHDRNRGVSAARNTALAVARGKYALFVDGDDWLEDSYVEHFVTAMIDGGYDLVVNPYITERDSSRIFSDKDNARVPSDRKLAPRELTRRQFLDGVRSPIGQVRGYLWNKIYRMDIINSYRLRFDTEVSMMEDELFTVEYAVRVQSFYYGGCADYHYVTHAGSATTESPVKMLPQQLLSLHRVNRIIAAIDHGESEAEGETEA